MGLFDFLFGSDEVRTRVFISFANEDMRYRDYLIRQARSEKSPFDFMDMSIKEPYPRAEWKARCRTKIKRCHGMIVLLSSHTYQSSGARWEIECAKKEGVKVVGMYTRHSDRCAIPPELKGKRTMTWTWNNIERYIDSL